MDWGDYEVGPTGLSPVDLRAWEVEDPGRVVFDHPWHPTLVEEPMRLQNGHPVMWLRHADHRDGVDSKGAAGAVCRREDGKILVCWQWNPGPQELVAEFPGGGINPGESDLEGVRREVAEEVGLLANTIVPLGRYYFDHRRSSRMSSRFLCTDLTPVEATGEEAAIASAWLTEADIEAEIAGGRILNQGFLATWTLYRSHGR